MGAGLCRINSSNVLLPTAAAMTAPLGFAKVLHGTERPGHGPIYRSILEPQLPIPPDAGNPENPLVGLTLPQAESIHHAFQQCVAEFADMPCFGWRPIVDGEAQAFEWFTYSQVGTMVTHASAGLWHLQLLPLRDGFRMLGIYMKNSIDWMIMERAGYAYNGSIIALYDSLGPDSTEYILNQTEMATIACTIIELRKLTQLVPKCPFLKSVILCGDVMDEQVVKDARAANLRVVTLADLKAAGEQNPSEFEPPRPECIATIMYTSGTTGEPKGAMISHRAILSSSASTNDYLGKSPHRFVKDTAVYLSVLPLAHIYERTVLANMITRGGRVGFSQGNPARIIDDVRALRPTVFCAVPRLLNRMHDSIQAKMAAAPAPIAKMFTTALSVKLRRLQKYGVHDHAFWDRVFFRRIAESLGFDRCKLITCGSAPLSPDVLAFCRVAFCLDVLEGYGQTETCAGMSASVFGDNSGGFVGGPATSAEIKLVSVPEMGYEVTDRVHGDDLARIKCMGRGEICMRGPALFQGYFKQPERTREAMDDEGWLHTGDIGLWSPLGQLKIIDRKKNIFKLSQGEYVAPEKVEAALCTCPSVAQIFVTGDSFHSHLVAIIVPDEPVFKAMAIRNGFDPSVLGMQLLCDQPLLKTLVMQELDMASAKAKLAGFERVRQIYLHHEPFTVENELLTPTMKVRRGDAQKTFKKQIDQLYELSGDSIAGKNLTQQ